MLFQADENGSISFMLNLWSVVICCHLRSYDLNLGLERFIHHFTIFMMVPNPFVFLPLYLYPYNITSWSSITSSIAAHPHLDFHVIIAPNLANIFPDKNVIIPFCCSPLFATF